MNRAFVITAVLMLSPFPAFSQNAPGGEGHDFSYSRKDRDLEDILRDIGDRGREGSRRGGAAFFLRNGDAMVAVRCDPQDSMKSCVDSTLTLLDRARSMQPSGAPRRAARPGGSLRPDDGLDSVAGSAGGSVAVALETPKRRRLVLIGDVGEGHWPRGRRHPMNVSQSP